MTSSFWIGCSNIFKSVTLTSGDTTASQTCRVFCWGCAIRQTLSQLVPSAFFETPMSAQTMLSEVSQIGFGVLTCRILGRLVS